MTTQLLLIEDDVQYCLVLKLTGAFTLLYYTSLLRFFHGSEQRLLPLLPERI
ncbi:hypothetical protein [Spirosoma flavum]|uniref:Uncharacterized protein n=1 Tax=Spirosoma flavum TaxID=2048557 RepID=A0ABW6AJ37_9BACT